MKAADVKTGIKVRWVPIFAGNPDTGKVVDFHPSSGLVDIELPNGGTVKMRHSFLSPTKD